MSKGSSVPKKVGRPRKRAVGDSRSVTIVVSSAEHETISQMAQLSGDSITDALVKAAAERHLRLCREFIEASKVVNS